MTTIAVFGSINMDLVAQVERFPAPGETVIADGFNRFPGGKGANQAVAAARLGGQVTMFGMVGAGPFGGELLNSLKENRVQVERVLRQDTSSGMAMILVNESGENMIAITAGANGLVDREYVEYALPEISKAKVLLLQLEIPLEAIDTLLQRLPEGDPLVILDPAPVQELSDLAALERVDIITPNLGELEILAEMDIIGEERLKQAALRLVAEVGVRRIICKAGMNGAYLMDEQGRFIHIPAFAVEAIDTTAAGDAFNGGLAVALTRGEKLEEALRYANAAGALAVTRVGAQPSLPTAAEVRRLLERSDHEEGWHTE